MKKYSKKTTECHIDWTVTLREKMYARVEILWGHANYLCLTESLDLYEISL